MKSMLRSCIRNVATAALLALLAGAGQGHAQMSTVLYKGHEAHATRILAQVKAGTSLDDQVATLARERVLAARDYALVPGLVMLEIDEPVAVMRAGESPEAAQARQAQRLHETIEALQRSGLYEYVEPDYIVRTHRVPTDAAFTDGRLWGLRNTGQNGGTAGVDIDAVRAWDITTGSSDVIVAVIDSGIRYTHQDLAANMWRNPGEIPGNGIDDDGNGYVDDVHGIDAINGSGNPMDADGHGTHVAGTIGAVANNAREHVGVAWNVRLMALKFIHEEGRGTTSDAIESFAYAAAHGARIINCSWGGEMFSHSLYKAMRAIEDAGVLVVASAGNEARLNDYYRVYPSSFDLGNIVSVAAHDRVGNLAEFSNYGTSSVHIAAPGVQVFSTDAASNRAYATESGTSAAAPHVSGAAALVFAAHPRLGAVDVRRRLLEHSRSRASLAGKTATSGSLDAFSALAATGDGRIRISVTVASGIPLPMGGRVRVEVAVRNLDGVLGAVVSGAFGAGEEVVFADDGESGDRRAADGTYSAWLDVPVGSSSVVLAIHAHAVGLASAHESFTYSVRPPPPNDRFEDRVSLASWESVTYERNAGSSLERGEPAHAGQPGGASLWWSWTAPNHGWVTIDTVFSDFDTLLGVYTGESLESLVRVAASDDIDETNQRSRVRVLVQRGATYQIAVDGWDGATGRIGLRVAPEMPPVNDDFENRIQLVGTDVQVQGTTGNATAQPGEPQHPGASVGARSVWWTWTAPATGIARIEGYEVVAVYTGASLATLRLAPGIESDSDARKTIATKAGTSYHIVVASPVESSSRRIEFSLVQLEGPANDHFENSAWMEGTAATVTGQAELATLEAGEPAQNGQSLWWSWTAPHGGVAYVTGSRRYVWPSVAAYVGDAVDVLQAVPQSVVSTLSPSARRITFPAVAGATYRFAVSAAGGLPVQLSVELHGWASNDHFANRLQLSGERVSVSGTTAGSTLEASEPPVGMRPPVGGTVWWSWTAPRSGTLAVRAGNWGEEFALFTGTSLNSLTPIPTGSAWIDDESVVMARVQAGVNYHIRMAGRAGYERVFSFDLEVHDTPSNERFTTATTLPGETTGWTADTHWAVDKTIWYRWTAPASGTVLLGAKAGEDNLTLDAYTGSTEATLAPCSFRLSLPSYPPVVGFAVTRGVVYHIAVSAQRPGEFELEFELVDPPANDSFAQRIRIEGTRATVVGSTVGATPDVVAGEYQVPLGPATVWWTWTAPASGRVLLDVARSEKPSRIGVYTGASVPTLTRIASSGDNWQVGYSRALFDTQAGATYQIVVTDIGLGVGQVVLDLEASVPPSNDSFSSATRIEGRAARLDVDNFGATREPGEPHHGGHYSIGSSAWWVWTAPASGTAVLELAEPLQGVAPSIGVYLGGALSELRVVPNAESSTPRSRYVFRAEAGEAYRIAVDAEQGVGGTFVIDFALVDGPANDNFADAFAVQSDDSRLEVSTERATLEPGESAGVNYDHRRSLWWTWTMPRSGVAVVDLGDDHLFGAVVYRGQTRESLQVVRASFIGRQLAFRVESGEVYRVALTSRQEEVGHVRLCVVDPPANDDLERSRVVDGSHVLESATNFGATKEGGEPSYNPYGGIDGITASVWWSWTAPATGRMFAEMHHESRGRPVIAVFRETGNAWTRVENKLSGVYERQLVDVQAGARYHIVTDFEYADMADFTLEMRLFTPPVNETFESRAVIAPGGGTVVGTTLGAGADTVGVDWSRGPPVWWAWTAPADGLAVVVVRSPHVTPLVEVRTGNSRDDLTYLAGSPWMYQEPAGRRSAGCRFTAVAGTQYQIRVAGANATMGDVELTVGLVDEPPNDAFAAALPIVGWSAEATGTNMGATAEDGEPWSMDWSPYASVWWRWTAPFSGPVNVRHDRSDFHAIVAVHRGTDLASLERLASNVRESSREAPVAFMAEAGVTYGVSVDGSGGSMGSIVLELEGPVPPRAEASVSRSLVLAGEAIVLESRVSGTGPFAYQWLRDGAAVVGATESSLVLRSAQRFQRGSYVLRVSTPYGTWDSEPVLVDVKAAPAGASRLMNLSTRALGGTGEAALIPGFVLRGEGTRALLLRAVGPALADFGVEGVMADPRVFLKRRVGSEHLHISSNGDWSDDGRASEIAETAERLGAFSLGVGSKDAALLVEVEAGNYTLVSDDAAGGGGIAMVEVYDASEESAVAAPKLVNLSNRGLVADGAGVMIPGFVVSSEGPKTLLLRAVGPGLAQHGVTGVLTDPRLTVYRTDPATGVQEAILWNDNWGENGDAADIAAVAEQVGAFELESGSKDAAFVITLQPGVYTVHAAGADGRTGVALVELYLVD